MYSYAQKNTNELKKIKKELLESYTSYKMQNLKLDMSRGKPCIEQLDLSNDILKIDISDYKTDLRNYGGLDGIIEIKELFGSILNLSTDEIIVGGNSSLSLMYDTFIRAMYLGVSGGNPWTKNEKVKFLCPSPGYDRHFSICELLGIEMISIDLLENGPDMDRVRELVENDETIKGMWCVPKYSNPTGIIYSDTVIREIANLKPKAENFRLFWDNAYMVHDLEDNSSEILNILDECKKVGNEDMVYIFASTSKVTFAGAGISIIAASKNNVKYIKNQLSIKTIGSDKVNQYRHYKFLNSFENIKLHMKKHAMIIKPKFDKVIEILNMQLKNLGIATWTNPKGGYFISFDSYDGCAKKIIKMALDAGLKMTEAGATFPYKNDPNDKNIRIAPTFPSLDELEKAMDLFCICVKISSIDKLIENN
ncbi:MAG: aminotransferase class I/II-fold pyridoxal phosphate-dependent enzyme [Clostridiales bacterium]